MKSESDVKRDMVQSVKQNGGYARRIEDQYGVGIFDTLLMPAGLPMFCAEVKIIRAELFGPTSRQFIELDRVKKAAQDKGHVVPIVIGWRNGIFYFSELAEDIDPRGCFSVTTKDMSFHDQLVQFHASRRK